MTTYTAEQKAEALRLYAEVGPAEAGRRTGVSAGTVSKWAQRAGIVSETAAATREATEAAAARRALLREEVRNELLSKILDGLRRMDEPHIEFKATSRSVEQVQYPKAPPEAFRAYAQSVAAMLRELRTELGEATTRNELDVRGRVAAVAEQMGLDVDEVMAEAEAILRSGK